jgi:hypothetical protein
VHPVAHMILNSSCTHVSIDSGSILRTSFVLASGPGALPLLSVERASLNSSLSFILNKFVR